MIFLWSTECLFITFTLIPLIILFSHLWLLSISNLIHQALLGDALAKLSVSSRCLDINELVLFCRVVFVWCPKRIAFYYAKVFVIRMSKTLTLLKTFVRQIKRPPIPTVPAVKNYIAFTCTFNISHRQITSKFI